MYFCSAFEDRFDWPFEEKADWERDEASGELDFGEEWIIIVVSTVMGFGEDSKEVEVSPEETAVDSDRNELASTLVSAVVKRRR